MAKTRLDKLLANRTPHSRSEVKALLRRGAVEVNGIIERDGSRQIDLAVEKVKCCGKTVQSEEHVYYLLNKPLGVICATEDREHTTVIDLLPPELRVKGLFPAGRLDADSTGMVFLTDDGALAHRMLSPKHHVPKFYLIRLARPYEAVYEERFADGMLLSDGTQCLPAEIVPVPADDHCAVVCLREGKYHQVRRMLAAAGNHVEQLHRVGIGSLLLPEALKPGEHLEIIHKDVESMLNEPRPEVVCERIMTNFSSYLINDSQ